MRRVVLVAVLAWGFPALAVGIEGSPAAAQGPREAAVQQPATAASQEVHEVAADTSGPRAPGFRVLRRRLEEVRRRRVAQFLHLDPAQADAVQREFVGFRQRQQELRGERERLLGDLRGALDGQRADEALLRGRLDALRKNQEERDRSLAALKERLSRELTLEQQARLVLFSERFQDQIAESRRRVDARRETGVEGPPAPRPLR